MRQLIYCFWLLLLPLLSFGQCPDIISINSQEQIDEFAISYPGCNNVEELLISGTDIVNLSGLSQIEEVSEHLKISGTNILNMDGLENIEGHIEVLEISNNNNLTGTDFCNNCDLINLFKVDSNIALSEISGFDNLLEVGSLNIINNPLLIDIDVFENLNELVSLVVKDNQNLVSIGSFSNSMYCDFIEIVGNNSLEYIDIFQNVEFIHSAIITSNSSLLSISGFSSAQILNYLEIDDNANLESISDFNNSVSIKEIKVSNNSLLQIIDGFNSSIVNESFILLGNSILSDISGFAQTNFENLDTMRIQNNSILEMCNLTSICNWVMVGNLPEIENNGLACNSIEALENACGIICDIEVGIISSTGDEYCDGLSFTLSIDTIVAGIGEMNFEWSNGNSGSEIMVTSYQDAVSYSVTATDEMGCGFISSIDLVASENLYGSIAGGIFGSMCPDVEMDLIAIPEGGLAPYSFEWSNGATTQVVVVSDQGDYEVTITDQNGCTAVDDIGLNNCPNCMIGGTVTNVVCNDGGTNENPFDDTYTFTFIATGSNVGETWSGFDPWDLIGEYGVPYELGPFPIESGTYDLFTINDTESGVCLSAIVVLLPTMCSPGCEFDLEIEGDSDICTNDSATLTAIAEYNGNETFEYFWSTNETSETIVVQPEFTSEYFVTVTDETGCSLIDTFIVHTIFQDFNDWESGWGKWNDGGSDAAISDNPNYAQSGTHSALIKDNTTTSYIVTDPIDLSITNSFKMEFSFITTGFKLSDQKFHLELSTDNGLSFEPIKIWQHGIEFENNIRVFENLTINGPFSNQSVLRFRCDAPGNNKKVYLDDIDIPVCQESFVSCINGNQNSCHCSTTDTIKTAEIFDGFSFPMASFSHPEDAPSELCIEEVPNGTPQNPIWIAFEAWCEQIYFEVIPSNCVNNESDYFGIQTAIYSSCAPTYSEIFCNASVYDCGTAEIEEILLQDLIIGSTYYILIDGCSGSYCDIEFNLLNDCGEECDLEIEIVSDPPIVCEGVNEVELAILLPTGTSTGVEYNWSNGQNSETIVVDLNDNLDFSVTVTDSDFCIASAEIVLQINPESFVDFESGLDIWIDGGVDAALEDNPNFANSGTYSMMIKDNTNTSIMTSSSFNLASFENVNIDFNFVTEGFNSTNQDFWLQISLDDGNSFSTVQEWVYDIDFTNEIREFENLNISGPFTDETKFRFRCDADGNNDKVYIDDVLITTCFEIEPCASLDFNTVEIDWGIWNDGGADAARANNANFANSGTYSFLIKDNTSTSVITTDAMDLSGYDSLIIEFNFIADGFNNNTQDFWLQVSTDNGTTFTTAWEWSYDSDFLNGVREFENIPIVGTFSDQTMLRFRCDATGNNDKIYIDDILITACNDNGLIEPILSDSREANDHVVTIHPNPISLGGQLNVQFDTAEKYNEIVLLNLSGQVISKRQLDLETKELFFGTGFLEEGMYILQLKGENQIVSKKVMIINQ